MRPARAAVLFCAALAGAGCYDYRPTVQHHALVGHEVRVRLTANGTTELARYLGPSVVAAEGRAVTIDSAGGITIAIATVRTAFGGLRPWEGERPVRFPPELLEVVETRVLSRRKTVFAAIGATAAAIGIAIMALQQGDAGGGGPPPPPPPG